MIHTTVPAKLSCFIVRLFSLICRLLPFVYSVLYFVWMHSQMPEEQAFCVLKKIMFDYGMRSLFLQGFEELHLKFYLLDRLIQVIRRTV